MGCCMVTFGCQVCMYLANLSGVHTGQAPTEHCEVLCRRRKGRQQFISLSVV